MSGRRHRLNSVATAGLVVLLSAAPAMGQTAREVEDVFWRDVVCERELEVRAYLETYPDGAYVSEARACLERGLGLTRTERVAVQRGLAEVGQEPGPADGLFGGPETKTRQAIRAWRVAKGYLSREQADILIVTGQAVEERQRAAAERTAQEEAARQAAAVDDAAYAAAYGEYLEEHPAGRHADAARERQAARWENEAYRVGRTFRDALRSGGEGPEMVVVPAGAFRMGCVSGQGCYDDERPVHRVTIGSPFAVGVYEVTFAEWDTCVKAGMCGRYQPEDEGWGRGKRPVINVSLGDTLAYIAWLSRESGEKYRLLSEAEWEYVARAGSEMAYSWGNEIGRNRANCRGAGVVGTVSRRRRLGCSGGTPSGCTTCMGMWRSGSRTGGMTITPGHRRTERHGREDIVRPAWCAGVPGTATRGSSGPRTATGSPPAQLHRIPCCSELNPLNPYLLMFWGSKGGLPPWFGFSRLIVR